MILRHKQTVRIKSLTEDWVYTFDSAHHDLDQSIPHSIGSLKEKFRVHNLSFPFISKLEINDIFYPNYDIVKKCTQIYGMSKQNR